MGRFFAVADGVSLPVGSEAADADAVRPSFSLAWWTSFSTRCCSVGAGGMYGIIVAVRVRRAPGETRSSGVVSGLNQFPSRRSFIVTAFDHEERARLNLSLC